MEMKRLDELSLRERVGQRLVGGFSTPVPNEEFLQLIRDYKLGNIILFKENIVSAVQLRSLCDMLQREVMAATGVPAFIAIDQEGGVVSRLSEDATNMPGAMAIAATGNPEYAYDAGKITATELISMGVNFNVAPSMDINSNPSNPVIGVRSYGDTYDTVIKYGVRMIEGLKQGGVMCAAKHFPGHGDTNVDSHFGLPVVNKTYDEMVESELRPFQAAIDAGIPAIMTSHILFPQMEPDGLPATMSRRIITGILKKKMQFDGIVISDSMEMNAIKAGFGVVNGSVVAMNAGVDMVCICHTASFIREVSDEAMKAVEDGRIFGQELDTSVEKILKYKQEIFSKVPPSMAVVSCEEHRAKAKQIMAETITPVITPKGKIPNIGNKPFVVAPCPFSSEHGLNKTNDNVNFATRLARELHGEGMTIPMDPTGEDILEVIKGARRRTAVIVGTYNAHFSEGQIALVRAISRQNSNVIVVALRNPYDLKYLPGNVTGICAYEYSNLSIDAIAKVLRGEATATGRLPIASF